MEYKNDNLGVRLEVVDNPTVRRQLAYKSALFGAKADEFYEGLWMAARNYIDTLECEYLTLDTDISTVTDKRITDALIWIGLTVWGHYSRLDTTPKNS